MAAVAKFPNFIRKLEVASRQFCVIVDLRQNNCRRGSGFIHQLAGLGEI
jgi:hypothetical protein